MRKSTNKLPAILTKKREKTEISNINNEMGITTDPSLLKTIDNNKNNPTQIDWTT